MDLAEVAEIGKKTLPADAPDGAWVRDESPEFLALDAEVSKLSSVHGGGQVNWRKVAEYATTILERHSKDILASSYLCRALWEGHGYQGLSTALQVMRDLLVEHWETAYPLYSRKRAKRRGNEVEWIADKLAPFLTAKVPDDAAEPWVLQASTLLREIDSFLMEKLEDAAPALRPIKEPLETYRQHFLFEAEKRKEQEASQQSQSNAVETATTAADQAEQSPAEVKPQQSKEVQQEGAVAAASTSAQSARSAQSGASVPQSAASFSAATAVQGLASAASSKEVEKAIKECQVALGQIADFRRGLDATDPAPYRMLRQSAWMGIDGPPKVDPKTGRCFFPSVPTSVRKQCETLFQQQQYLELIELVEKSFAKPGAPGNPYWMDGHRWCVMAMEALGGAYDSARQVIIAELLLFLQRVPGIELRSDRDGLSLADEQTRFWLEEERAAAGGGGESSGAGPGATSDGGEKGADQQQEQAALLKEARKLAAKGGMAEALQQLQRYTGTSNQRERFAWELEKARFCSDLGQIALALPLLEYLDTLVERYALEEWEPMLSAEVAHLLILCYSKLPERYPKKGERFQQVFDRLCRLNAPLALGLAK